MATERVEWLTVDTEAPDILPQLRRRGVKALRRLRCRHHSLDMVVAMLKPYVGPETREVIAGDCHYVCPTSRYELDLPAVLIETNLLVYNSESLCGFDGGFLSLSHYASLRVDTDANAAAVAVECLIN